MYIATLWSMHHNTTSKLEDSSLIIIPPNIAFIALSAYNVLQYDCTDFSMQQ